MIQSVHPSGGLALLLLGRQAAHAMARRRGPQQFPQVGSVVGFGKHIVRSVLYHLAAEGGVGLPRANKTIYGLAPGVWRRDISKAHRLANELRAGTVWINCYNIFHAALPFGGYKQSGWGREMGHEVLEHYTETKTIVARL
jgi:hypothetical protein